MLKICLYFYLFCRNLARLVIFVQFLHCCCQHIGLREPYIYLLLTNSSFTLLLSESCTGDILFGQICQISKATIESQLDVISPCSVL